MTTASRANEGLIGIGIQSAEGTALGTATFAHTLYGGLPRPVRVDNEMEVASVDQFVPGIFASTQHWEGAPSFPLLPASAGAWLRAMFGTVSTSGSGTLTHVFTPAASPPFVTLFGRHPGTAYRKFADGTLGELTIQFEAGMPLRAQASAMGYTPSDLASAWTATTTEAFDTDGPFFTYNGATMLFDDDATPAATEVATIRGGTLVFSRGLELIQTDDFEPEHRSLGLFKVSYALEVLFANYETFKATYYGAVNGTTSSPVQKVGALDFTFQVGPTAEASTRTLQIEIPTSKAAVIDPPDVDPGAGPVLVNIAGTTWKASGTEIATATLVNETASY